MVDELDKNLNANRDKRRHVRYLDWRLISSFGYVFGGLSLIVGIYVYVYYKTDWIGWIGLAFNPYQNYAIPLIIAGIALLIIGFIAEERARKKIKDVEKQQSMLMPNTAKNAARNSNDYKLCFFAYEHACVLRLCENIFNFRKLPSLWLSIKVPGHVFLNKSNF
jgi:uncharacterized membrane protein